MIACWWVGVKGTKETPDSRSTHHCICATALRRRRRRGWQRRSGVRTPAVSLLGLAQLCSAPTRKQRVARRPTCTKARSLRQCRCWPPDPLHAGAQMRVHRLCARLATRRRAAARQGTSAGTYVVELLVARSRCRCPAQPLALARGVVSRRRSRRSRSRARQPLRHLTALESGTPPGRPPMLTGHESMPPTPP